MKYRIFIYLFLSHNSGKRYLEETGTKYLSNFATPSGRWPHRPSGHYVTSV